MRVLLLIPSSSFHHFRLPLSPSSCQSVPCFHVSGSVLLLSLFCSFDSSYKLDHTVFVFNISGSSEIERHYKHFFLLRIEKVCFVIYDSLSRHINRGWVHFQWDESMWVCLSLIANNLYSSYFSTQNFFPPQPSVISVLLLGLILQKLTCSPINQMVGVSFLAQIYYIYLTSQT